MDQRVVKTRKALLSAFNTLLAHKPLEDISVSDICETAMVRRTTFYRHFANKEEFLAFVIADIQASFESRYFEVGFDGRDYCRFVIAAYFEFIEDNRSLMDALVASPQFPMALGIVSKHTTDDLYAYLLSEDPTRDELATEVFTHAFVGALTQIVTQWLRHNPTEPALAMMKRSEEVLLGMTLP